ncbi:glycosyltransferase family protein [Pontibacter chinhatensis]|uniref:Glycosyltransferase involved in cell wall bisynthesis n=1 Tax=Pontibacter chinhatensis TaxID=1436961 RepID=A0A1I2WYX7_9BACT|nr:glycosyltransferase family 4 protein [Pontibacter chinhatensis]SFH06475.1 Glycosyltransferase involved in cell wall bisynthesis [Pontibacter chinhatensis]
MRIAFICGSLEPGRDGVGDYTRRMAGELVRQGHQAFIMSLRDLNIPDTLIGNQKDGSIDIPVLRIPAGLGREECMEQASLWLEHFKPDCISLQFVPFAYHAKGLPYRLSHQLNSIRKARQLHIMFHELWVGMNEGAPVKYKVWGWLQRLMIQTLLADLKPEIIQTQTEAYQILLAKLGYDVKLLPLFSNIPLVNPNKEKTAVSYRGTGELSFILFGAIHYNAPVKDFANEVQEYAKVNSMQVRLFMVGKCGDEQRNWEEVFRSIGADVQNLGQQPPEVISGMLSRASVGISTTPLALADKSGSVMAMKEHGLPVICVSALWKPAGINNLKQPLGVSEYRKGNLAKCLSADAYCSDTNGLEMVSQQFISAIQGKV